MIITKNLFLSLGVLLATGLLAIGQVTEMAALNRSTGEVSEFLLVELPGDAVPEAVLQAFNTGEVIDSLTVEVPLADEQGKPVCYLRYKLDRCFVKSWSTSGDAGDRPTEEVAFYYNKIAFQYVEVSPGRSEGHLTPLDALMIINR